MAGCAKAGRKKKSAANARYVAGRRKEINKDKKQARHLKRVAKKAARKVAVKGLTRMLRRKEWMHSIGGMWESKDRVSFQTFEKKKAS